jgi:GNAT superfamily N-acetyltransferase
VTTFATYDPGMDRIRIVDVTDAATFGLLPPCADASFDHRSCDYWEDAERGSRAARSSWLDAPAPPAPRRPDLAENPFAPPPRTGPVVNPFADDDADDDADNPFVPRVVRERPASFGVPRKYALLDRGRGVFGTYAKVALLGDEAVAYAQFGPLSAYPRALRTRELYPRLPASPLPAVITCIATTAAARDRGLATMLVEAVCDDLAGRGFAAVETYPESGARPDATSAAAPGFWERLGFTVAAADDRFPVMRRELR